MTLEQIFNNTKLTENGDVTYSSTGNSLLDILFMSEYYSKNLDKVKIGNSDKEKLFSMFIRDPRFGLGKRDLGRRLMLMSGVTPDNVVKAGRFDDLFIGWEYMSDEAFFAMCSYLYNEIKNGNELCKKWMPRYSSKNLMLARRIAKTLGMNKQQYGHFVKCDTTENKLSRKNTESIEFEHVPSLAMIKYFKRFSHGEDTCKRFEKYLEDVKSGKKDLKVSTTNVYDICKNRFNIDADLFFSKIEKISGSWIPVVDTSGSMHDNNDSMTKALAVGHYLAKCSTYAPDTVVSFSAKPSLLKLGVENTFTDNWCALPETQHFSETVKKSQYLKEISSMYTGDCSNTNFKAVCDLLKNLDKDNAPEWIVVLSDMEFDCGSSTSKDEMMRIFKENGMNNTKLLWWNFNSRSTTCPETDKYGNIFLSGYSPILLKYLQVGFDGEQFLDALLDGYKKNIQ